MVLFLESKWKRSRFTLPWPLVYVKVHRHVPTAINFLHPNVNSYRIKNSPVNDRDILIDNPQRPQHNFENVFILCVYSSLFQISLHGSSRRKEILLSREHFHFLRRDCRGVWIKCGTGDKWKFAYRPARCFKF